MKWEEEIELGIKKKNSQKVKEKVSSQYDELFIVVLVHLTKHRQFVKRIFVSKRFRFGEKVSSDNFCRIATTPPSSLHTFLYFSFALLLCT